MTTKSKRMHLHMPEHLKNQIESAANYYGITQAEFIKDAIKVQLIQYEKDKSIVGMFFNGAVK